MLLLLSDEEGFEDVFLPVDVLPFIDGVFSLATLVCNAKVGDIRWYKLTRNLARCFYFFSASPFIISLAENSPRPELRRA
jgi:hypothetical protein